MFRNGTIDAISGRIAKYEKVFTDSSVAQKMNKLKWKAVLDL